MIFSAHEFSSLSGVGLRTFSRTLLTVQDLPATAFSTVMPFAFATDSRSSVVWIGFLFRIADDYFGENDGVVEVCCLCVDGWVF